MPPSPTCAPKVATASPPDAKTTPRPGCASLPDRGGTIRIDDNFGGRNPEWNRADVKEVGDHFEVDAKVGQEIEATLPKPEAIPPAPTNVAPNLNP